MWSVPMVLFRIDFWVVIDCFVEGVNCFSSAIF